MIKYKKEQQEKKEKQEKLHLELKQKATENLNEGEIEKAVNILKKTNVPIIMEPKVQGVSSRDNWKAELKDMRQLIQDIFNGTAPIEFIQINQTAINAESRRKKIEETKNGIKYYNDVGLSVR